MMAKTLYLMRHGQTLFNLRHKVQGWCDAPLTDFGIYQAKVAGKYFKDAGITFDDAYSSTQERACDTLELVTDGKLPYKRVKGLKEWNFGTFEGESEDQSVLMVSHGGAMANFARAWQKNWRLDDLGHMTNCGILKFTFEDDQFYLEEAIGHDFSDWEGK